MNLRRTIRLASLAVDLGLAAVPVRDYEGGWRLNNNAPGQAPKPNTCILQRN
jgi:hypothetical protein